MSDYEKMPDQVALGHRLIDEGTYVETRAPLLKCHHATLYRALQPQKRTARMMTQYGRRGLHAIRAANALDYALRPDHLRFKLLG
jgi:hypothetical protein